MFRVCHDVAVLPPHLPRRIFTCFPWVVELQHVHVVVRCSLSRSSGISVDELRAMSAPGVGRRGRRAASSRRCTLPPGLGARMVKVEMPAGGDAGEDTAFEHSAAKQ